MIKQLLDKWRMRHMYVIADARDNSVTFSKGLFKRLELAGLEQAKIFCFAIPETKEYGFTLNPKMEQETQMGDVQYNGKYKTFGFECLNPSVNKIFYDYGLGHSCAVKLSVKECVAGELRYYKICRPQ